MCEKRICTGVLQPLPPPLNVESFSCQMIVLTYETQIRSIIYTEPCALFWPWSNRALPWKGVWTPSSGHTRTVQKIIQYTQLHILCTCLFYSKVYKGSVIFYIFVFIRIFVIPFSKGILFSTTFDTLLLDWTFFTDYFYTPFLAGF